MQEAVEATKAAEKLMVESAVYESPSPGEKEKEEEEEAKWETLSNHVNIPHNVFVQRECVIFTRVFWACFEDYIYILHSECILHVLL